jgi:hypothetical protein
MISFSANQPGSNAQLYKICEPEPFWGYKGKGEMRSEMKRSKDAADYASLFELLISSEEKNKGKGR